MDCENFPVITEWPTKCYPRCSERVRGNLSSKIPTHHLFMDFKATYDSIVRVNLGKTMDENSFLEMLTRLITDDSKMTSIVLRDF